MMDTSNSDTDHDDDTNNDNKDVDVGRELRIDRFECIVLSACDRLLV